MYDILKGNVYSLIFVIVVVYLFMNSKPEKSIVNSQYKRMLFTAVFHLIFDMLSICSTMYIDKLPYLLNRIIHQLSLGTLLTLFLIVYRFLMALIDEELKRVPSKRYHTKVIFWIGAIGVMVGPIYYNQKDIFSYGLGVYIIYVCSLVFAILTIVTIIKYKSIISEKNLTALKLAFVVEGILTTIQMLLPWSKLSCFGVAILIFGFYLIAENPDAILAKDLYEANKKADAANVAKTEFLAHMSHEIRTPINAVLGMNEMILRESKEDNVKGYAREIKGAAKSLLGIINDILDISKIEAGKIQINPVEYRLSNLLSDVYNMIYFRAKEKELDFSVSLDENLPSILVGDDIRIKQILINLLTNAVKYTEQGSVVLEVKRLEDDTFMFAVRDTGIGIKKEDIERLYIPFERMEQVRNRHIEGTGLGLNITMQLLVLQDSRLEVESEYGKGSVFSFVLSQKVVDEHPLHIEFDREIIAPEEIYQPVKEMPDARVLVVDDNEINRMILVELLKETKMQIEDVDSGYACLEKTKEKEYDLILMDHMMPGLDGVETFKKIRSDETNKCYEVPIVVVTANAIVGDREKYMDIGFTEYLSKPIDPDELEKVIFDLIG